MAHVTPNYILWWEPRWSFASREIREFQSSLRLRSWLRIIAISAIVTVTIALLTTALVPGLQFNWIAAFTGTVAAIVVFLLVCLLLLVTIPPLVFITQSGIGWWWPPMLHEGFAYFKRSDLKKVTLTVRADGKTYLRFRTKRFCKRIGVSGRVKLDSLLELIGELLVVRDRRRRGSTESPSPASIPGEMYAN